MRLVTEFDDRIRLSVKLRKLSFHKTGSAIGVKQNEQIGSFMMSVILGAGNCNSASQLSYDDVLKEIFQWKIGMPSQSTLSRFFPKYYHNLSDEIFSELFNCLYTEIGQKNLTQDIGSTFITSFGNQEVAEKGYYPNRHRRKSHHPIIAFVAKTKMIANAWMRTGDRASATEFKIFLFNNFTMIPWEYIGVLRGDSGFSGNNVHNELELWQLDYIIALHMKADLVDSMLSRRKWVVSQTQGVDLPSLIFQSKGW